MNEYTVHLWANLPTGLIRAETVQGKTEMHAAALALKHFKQIGYDFSNPISRITVDMPNDKEIIVPVRDVLRWLQQPEQAEFMQNENLSALVQ
jgi:hypothetical protein